MTAPPCRIAVLVEEGFEDADLSTMIGAFSAAGASITLVAPVEGRQYAGRNGRVKVTSELAAGSARAQMFRAIVIPGGYAPDRLRMRHAVLDLVRDALAAGIPVCAIGHGPHVLISAAALKGRTVTCWPSIAIDVTNAGGLYVDRPVVEDGGILTARKSADVGALADAVLRAIRHSR